MIGNSIYDAEVTDKNIIKNLLNSLNYKFAGIIFYNLEINKFFNSTLEEADFQTRRIYINRHDKKHAMKSVQNAIHIFKILNDKHTLNNISCSILDSNRTIEFRPDDSYSIQEHMLSMIIISSYCHDMGRCYITDYAKKSWEDSEIEITNLLKLYYPDTWNIMRTLVRQCIENHEAETEKEQIYGEQGIVTLADLLDNSKNRVQPNETEEVALLYDPKPIEYFSCKAIKDIILMQGEKRPICIEYDITNYAAIYQITLAIEKIKKIKLSNLIEVKINFLKNRKKLQIYPKKI